MILAADIGNTNISVALFSDGSEPLRIKSFPDNRFHSSEEIYKALKDEFPPVSGAVLCSVVPPLTEAVKKALERLTDGSVRVIDASYPDGMKLSGYDRNKLGNDRIADMTAAKALYGVPCAVFDMGTATTVSVIDADGVFVGGLIMPGLGLSINALSSGTALLPVVEPVVPGEMLGNNTADCINNGVIFSQASAIEGICARLDEAFSEKVKTVVTGGAAKFILPLCRREAVYDENLLFKGLRILYEKG